MDTLSGLFAHICGQARPFVVDGVALPVCQRCLGLYAGAAATLVWLLVASIHRRGMPRGAALLVQVAVLLAALLGGLHVIDAGPRWRFACGLWTGHVVIVWLLSASAELRIGAAPSHRGGGGAAVRAIVFVAALGLLAVAWNGVSVLGWWFWTGAVVAGALAILVAMIVAAASVAAMAWADGASRLTGRGSSKAATH